MRIGSIVAAVLCLTGLSAAPALAQGATAGLEAGVSMSRLSPDGPGQSISRGAGFLAGGYVTVPVFATIGLQLELVYAQKNSHLTSSSDLKLDYIEVPILAKLKLVKGLYLAEGVAIGFPVRARISSSSGSDLDIKNQINSPEIGMVIGGGIPVKNFAIEFRYEGGFKLVIDTPGAPLQRNRSLSLIARVHF